MKKPKFQFESKWRELKGSTKVDDQMGRGLSTDMMLRSLARLGRKFRDCWLDRGVSSCISSYLGQVPAAYRYRRFSTHAMAVTTFSRFSEQMAPTRSATRANRHASSLPARHLQERRVPSFVWPPLSTGYDLTSRPLPQRAGPSARLTTYRKLLS
jgi:hypothetical protein